MPRTSCYNRIMSKSVLWGISQAANEQTESPNVIREKIEQFSWDSNTVLMSSKKISGNIFEKETKKNLLGHLREQFGHKLRILLSFLEAVGLDMRTSDELQNVISAKSFSNSN